jgi:hypothetical protein
VTPATASADAGLAGLVRLVRAAAGLIEQAGIPGLALFPHQDEIVIQIPSAAGDAATRAARVARLAALAGCEPAPDPRPGPTQGWIGASGTFAGCPVRIYTAVTKEEAP